MSKEEDDQRRRFREAQQRQRDEDLQRKLNEAAAAEENTRRRYNLNDDEGFEKEMRNLFGDGLDEIQAQVARASDAEVDQAMTAIRNSLSNKNFKRAKKLARKNKKKIKAAAKAGKKGCGVVAILLVGGLVAAFGSAGWLVVDTIGALTR